MKYFFDYSTLFLDLIVETHNITGSRPRLCMRSNFRRGISHQPSVRRENGPTF